MVWEGKFRNQPYNQVLNQKFATFKPNPQQFFSAVETFFSLFILFSSLKKNHEKLNLWEIGRCYLGKNCVSNFFLLFASKKLKHFWKRNCSNSFIEHSFLRKNYFYVLFLIFWPQGISTDYSLWWFYIETESFSINSSAVWNEYFVTMNFKVDELKWLQWNLKFCIFLVFHGST